jgi:guanylate kinase
MMRNIIIISGVSGVGKSTIIKNLIAKYKNKFYFAISKTTRNIRPEEKVNHDYYFISEKEFIRNIQQNIFLEYSQHFNTYYGTTTTEVYKDLSKTPILDISIEGFTSLKKNNQLNIISFFLILPKNIDQSYRIKSRGEMDEDQLKSRLKKAETEMKYKDLYDHIIINADIEDTTNKIYHTICKFFSL